jgi:CRISPR-associated protein Cas2
MVVLILERVPDSLRGELTRWLLEPRAGVFVGIVNAAVREKLWQRVCAAMAGGAGTLIYTARNEQGFEIRFWGATRRSVLDWEGLKLVSSPEE